MARRRPIPGPRRRPPRLPFLTNFPLNPFEKHPPSSVVVESMRLPSGIRLIVPEAFGVFFFSPNSMTSLDAQSHLSFLHVTLRNEYVWSPMPFDMIPVGMIVSPFSLSPCSRTHSPPKLVSILALSVVSLALSVVSPCPRSVSSSRSGSFRERASIASSSCGI